MPEEGNEGARVRNTEKDSILDKQPQRIFGHLLTVTQQIWIGYLLPSSFTCFLYVANLSVDIGVTYQLIRDGHWLLAATTLFFLYFPSITCLSLTIIKPPNLEGFCEYFSWIVIQLVHCLLFPIGVIHRFATLLFWSICALIDTDPAREKALRHITAPHQVNLFLWLDSFLHCAPQALFQAFILLSPKIYTSDETDLIEAVSIIISVASVAKTAALYHRYESQRIVGRMVPWTSQDNPNHPSSLIKISKVDPLVLMGLGIQGPAAAVPSIEVTLDQEGEIKSEDKDQDQTTQSKIINPDETETVVNTTEETCSNNGESVPGPSQPEKIPEEEDATAGTNTGDEPNDVDTLLPQEEDKKIEGDQTSNMTTLKPTLITGHLAAIESDARLFWPRIDTPPSTPTADPHMRPRRSFSTERNPTNPPLTSHIALPKRKPRIKGLNEDEPLGVLIAFFGSWCFIIARVLAVAAFIHFYPWPAFGIILAHYILMVAYLCFCKSCPNYSAPLLGMIFVLIPIEVKVHFKYPRMFLISFVTLVVIENISTVVLWYCGANWSSWWYKYTCYSIVGAQGMAVLYAALYIFLFQPKHKYVYE